MNEPVRRCRIAALSSLPRSGQQAQKLFAIQVRGTRKASAPSHSPAENKAQILVKSAQKAPRTVIEEKNFGSIASAQTPAARFFSG